MTLLRELIPIPERVHPGDFVLKLTDGVADPEATLGSYVVTPELAAAFDEALGMIGGALAGNNSKAAYLHGSFGSGKSHFMAVLDLLLAGNPLARANPDLAGVIDKHDEWLADPDRRFLLVPLYLIGASSLEQGILKGYVDRVHELHPEAPLPAVFRAGPLLDNADSLRSAMGDAAFFEALNQAGNGQGSGWGALAAGWDAQSYDAARHAGPGDADQRRLVGDLTTTLLTSFADAARSSGEAYVGLDDGLAALSQHAADLGYQGLVLFLDELVLWLISHVANVPFVTGEASKLSLLVESANPDRPVPIVSFVARQRDLSELVGEHALGNEYAALRERLDHVSGRFGVVPLEVRNLRVIAERRLLQPVDGEARRQIDAAFTETQRERPEVLRTQLGATGDLAAFRSTYPFSPAFVDALVDVSGALQRERTALRVMLQLLVDRRDDLELGKVVPVGDLWDVIVAGADAPFDPTMRERFAAAKRLYERTLRPLLLADHELDEDAAGRLPRTHAFVAADQLVKTLLLAALVPLIEPFRDLTVDRLAALNHGTIDTPLRGTENREVLSILRKLGRRTGAIRLGDEPSNPTVGIVISGVDTAGIVESARHVDNMGTRRLLLRSMIEAELGMAATTQLDQTHPFLWRGTRRLIDVVFANVRDATELPDAALETTGDTWKIVVDVPFDDAGHGPHEDFERIRSLQNAGITSQVLCWLPAFFTPATQHQLGDLVILDHVLNRERYDRYAAHLSAVDREAARGQLENQRRELRQSITHAINQAYGIGASDPAVVDTSHPPASRFPTLLSDLTIRPPVEADLASAFTALLDQVLSHGFPAHPAFGREVRRTDLKKVQSEVRRLLDDPNGRIVPEQGMRPLLRDIATPLRLGEQGQQGFVVDEHWLHHVLKVIESHRGTAPVTVGDLRASFDQPQAMGLPTDVADLVILVTCDKLGYSFTRHGGPWPGDIGNLPNDLELHKQALPEPEVWTEAVRRAAAIFGVEGVGHALTPANVADLTSRVVDAARRHRTSARDLIVTLEGRAGRYGVDLGSAKRLRTAAASAALIESLLTSPEADVPNVLAVSEVPTIDYSMGRSLASAEQVRRLVHEENWRIIDRAIELDGGERVRTALADAFAADERDLPLGGAMALARERATDLTVGDGTPSPPPEAPRPEDPRVGPPPGSGDPRDPAKAPGTSLEAREHKREVSAENLDELHGELAKELESRPGRRLQVWWRAIE